MVPRSAATGSEELTGNLTTDTDPAFVDPEQGDFRLREDSPAFGLGFTQIPMDRIGLQLDAWRGSLVIGSGQ